MLAVSLAFLTRLPYWSMRRAVSLP